MSGQYNGPASTGTITVAGSPAVEEVALGFVPGAIILKVLSGTNQGKTLFWDDQMVDDTGIRGNESFEASNGITKIPSNTEGKSAGFSLGVLTGISDVAADVISFVAFRSAK